VSTLGWIVAAGLAMAAIAMSGSLTLVLPERVFARVVPPLVALAAGSLAGGALFHMLPESVAVLDNDMTLYLAVAAGLVFMLVLEQYLHWHHCHKATGPHRPLGYLILLADGLHNLVGGLAVGSAFMVDIRLGVVTWLVAAAHEVPQELGDFGILVHSGWGRASALAYNVASGLTFLVGALLAYGLAGRVDLALLIPFAAGNFIYIALADLVPELTGPRSAGRKLVGTGGFAAGLALLYAVAAAG
jgi:zinc and cadmium transporter